MAISTDSQEWKDAETENPPILEEIEQFLKEHADQAFHGRELADEFLGTNWELAHEEDREIQRVGEDEFYERQERNEYDGKFDSDLGSTISRNAQTNRMYVYLDILEERGVIERRNVPVEATDIPYEKWEDVAYHTYSE